MSAPGDRGVDAGVLQPSFVPAGAVTGIGSLPTEDPSEAIDFVAACSPRVPFCPQPPSPHLLDDTLAQQFDRRPDGPDPWMDQFADAARRGAFPRALALKSQLTGPVTLAGLLHARQPVSTSPASLATVAGRVAARAVRQVECLRPLGLPVLVVVDEPALVLVDRLERAYPSMLLGRILDRVRLAGARAGIHCCATAAPGWIGAIGADVVSVDASEDGSPGTGDAGDVAVLDDDRRVIAFGLVGVTSRSEPLGRPFSRWLAAASRVADPQALARRTIVTPRCGLGRSTLREAEAAFAAAAVASHLVGEVARGVSISPPPLDARARQARP